MSIEMYPIRLIELRSIFGSIFGVEMFVGCGKVGLVDVGGLLVLFLSGKRISRGFYIINISVRFLLLS
jgi:hypothetical protein